MKERMSFGEFKTYFPDAKRNRNGSYQCRCPAHSDPKSSLNICEKEGKILIRCYARCDTRDILSAVGLTMQDINGKPDIAGWQKKAEQTKRKKIEAVYDYVDEDGKYLYSKVRFSGKYIRYFTIDAAGNTYQEGRRTEKRVLYNLPALIKAVDAGYPVYFVEGEKDVETLRKMGLTATTAGSASDWKAEYSKYFTGAKVIILPDNDRSGLDLKDTIIKDLKNYAHSIRWTTTSEAPKGDVTDFINEGHTKEELKQKISEAENIGAPWLYYTGKGENQTLKVNADILADCISKTMNYVVVRRPDDDKDDVYIYDHGVYRKSNRNAVKSKIRKYLPVGLATDNLLNNVHGLLICKNKNIRNFRELDADENYINFRNGLYDIRTKELRPHTPLVLSTLQLKCKYDPEVKNSPVTAKYFADLCKNEDGNIDKEKLQILQEFCGLAISNIPGYRCKKSLILWSPLGNSGKSQLLGLLDGILDGRVVNIPIQDMNETSKFALGGIADIRMICIGDQSGSEIKDSALFKQLTGGDAVKIEKKGRMPFYSVFRGVILIACNVLPAFTDDKGGHVFERLSIVKCENTIPEQERDPMILDNMFEERSAFVNWCLEGLHRLISNNYKFSKSVSCEAVLDQYRMRLDTVFAFLQDRYIFTGDKKDMVSKVDFETNYTAWCEANGHYGVKGRGAIAQRMEAIGCPHNQGRVNGRAGIMVYRCLKEKNGGFIECPEDMTWDKLTTEVRV